MKRMKQVVLIILLNMISGFCIGQSADAIVKKHIEAHGGAENWGKIQSLKIAGDFTAFSEVKPYTEFKARDGKFYSDHHKGQYRVIEGCNGATYWADDPWFELGFPHVANEAEKYVIQQKAEFCTPFFDYQQKGYSLSYEGIEKAEGVDTYKLVLTRDKGYREIWYLDTATYFEVMSVSRWADFAAPAAQQAFYDDFRKVGNIVLPFYTERVFSIRHRVVEIKDVEINPEFDTTIFDIPYSPQMEELSFLTGEWLVAVESPDRSGQMQLTDSSFSTIARAEGKNLLEENMTYTSYFPIGLIRNWVFNSDIQKYQMTAFNAFDSKMDIYTGAFSNDTLLMGKLDMSKAEKSNIQFKINKIDDDRFINEIYHSQDDGESWDLNQRFSYTRKP